MVSWVTERGLWPETYSGRCQYQDQKGVHHLKAENGTVTLAGFQFDVPDTLPETVHAEARVRTLQPTNSKASSGQPLTGSDGANEPGRTAEGKGPVASLWGDLCAAVKSNHMLHEAKLGLQSIYTGVDPDESGLSKQKME